MSGSSIGSIIGGIIGYALSPYTGGASLLVTSALMAAGGAIGGMLDAPKAQNFQGPRLSDLNQQTASYGAFIPRVYSKVGQFGNVFWIENNKLKEVATTQGQGGKGGPPEVNSTTYKYYATFAVGLCEGLDPALYGTGAELILAKLWINDKLFYNRYSADAETASTSIDKEAKFKFYSGKEDQLPEPRMEADLGVANCPGYRGLAYIVFYDFDVAPYGNSLVGAQIKAEVIASGTFDWSYFTHSAFSVSAGAATTLKGVSVNGYCYCTEFAASSLITVNAADPNSLSIVNTVTCASSPIDVAYEDGFVYVLGFGGLSNLQKWSLANPAAPVLAASTGSLGGSCRSVAVKDGHAYVGNDTLDRIQIFKTDTMSALGSVSTSNNPVAPVVSGNYLYIACTVGALSRLEIYDVSIKTAPFFVGAITLSAPNVKTMAVLGSYLYTAATNHDLIVVDISNPASPTVVFDHIGTLGNYTGTQILENLVICHKTNGNVFWYDITTPTSPVFVNEVNVTIPNGEGIFRGGDFFYAISTGNPAHRTITPFFFKKVLLQNQQTLQNIVESECLKSKLLSLSDLNASLLTQTVRGYRIASQGSIRSSLEPLQAAWPFDVVQDGYKIKYVPRGVANVATISYDKLDARQEGSENGVRITSAREMDTILPAKVAVKYLSAGRSYEVNEQSYQRINTDSVNVVSMDLPIVLNDTEAAGKAQTLNYLYWLERYDLSFTLPPEYLHLQPSDVIMITAPGASYNLRLKQINYTNDGRLECQAKYNRAAIYTPTALVDESPTDDDLLSPPGTTLYVPLDIPCLQDIYNTAGFPLAMTGTKKGWPGGVLSKSSDGGVSYSTVSAVPSPGTTMGKATNTIGAHSGGLMDKASVLNVKMTQGTLSSVSEIQLFNGSNHFAYGIDGRWEIIAAQTCILQGDGSYNLSDFLRGRFGTEVYTGNHAINDNVIYLTSAAMMFVTMNSSDIGLTRHYKGVNFQSTLDTATATTFIYNGVNLECLSPVYLNGDRNNPSNNDWTLTWIRRGRINNEWKDLIDVPVGETSESYDVEIYSSGTYVTLKRTIAGLTSAAATYTSAQQVTDFGSNQNTLFVKIYQNSATVGRGFPLTTSITR